MKSFVLIIFSFLIILTSCNQSSKNSNETQQSPSQSTANENLVESDTVPAQSIEADQALETPSDQKEEVAMLNPPHGQPNHRCDIPVGSPLNSAPSTPKSSSTTANTSNETQASSPAAGATNNSFAPTVENASKLKNPQTQSTTTANKGPKPATNPAHGQPYHRCDIPVGSKLP